MFISQIEKMTSSSLLSNENELFNQLPSDFLTSKLKSTRIELSAFQTEFEAFDNSSPRIAVINSTHCHQPQHIFESKLSFRASYRDFPSVMNRYFDDADDLNEPHAGDSYAQTSDGKDERKIGGVCNTNSSEFSRSCSYDVDAMRKNGETILEAVKNFPTPLRRTSSLLDPNLVANDRNRVNAGILTGKANMLDRALGVLSDDEDSLESIFDEPFEPDSSSCFSGNKRSHEDSFLSLLHALAKTSSRRNSSTCALTDLVDQRGCVHNDAVYLEEKAKALFENSRALTPLTEMGEDALSPCAKRVKLDGDAQSTPQGIVDGLKRMYRCMKKSAHTMKALQEWDKKNGLPKSHSQTMVNSSRSREQLQSGLVLQKWNGVPLLSLPGAKVKVIRRKFRGVKIAELED